MIRMTLAAGLMTMAMLCWAVLGTHEALGRLKRRR